MTTNAHRATRAATPGKKERTRNAILAVSARLFSENGIAATSILEITEALGISNGSFYYHFNSKDQLLQHVGHEVLANLVDKIESVVRPDPAAQVIRGPLIIFDYIDDHPQVFPIALRVVEDHEQAHMDLSDNLRLDVLRGIEEGRFDVSDVDTVVRFARGLLGTALRMRLEGNKDRQLPAMTAVQTLQLLGLTVSDARAVVALEQRMLADDRAQGAV